MQEERRNQTKSLVTGKKQHIPKCEKDVKKKGEKMKNQRKKNNWGLQDKSLKILREKKHP